MFARLKDSREIDNPSYRAATIEKKENKIFVPTHHQKKHLQYIYICLKHNKYQVYMQSMQYTDHQEHVNLKIIKKREVKITACTTYQTYKVTVQRM